MGTDRVPTKIAAKIMGVLPQYICQEMKAGRMDLGYVSGGKRKTYIIFRSKLEKLIGRKLTDEELRGE